MSTVCACATAWSVIVEPPPRQPAEAELEAALMRPAAAPAEPPRPAVTQQIAAAIGALFTQLLARLKKPDESEPAADAPQPAEAPPHKPFVFPRLHKPNFRRIAIMAGWIMGLVSWLVVASRETINQLICVWLATTVIGLAGFHHSVAGTVEVLVGVFLGQGATFGDYLRFLALAVPGNIIGGTVFVAILKWGHIQQNAG